MKKNNRQKLMEMMEKVNPDYKPSNPTEKEIINDILSLDEGVNDIISKMKNYARKGLLTATIIISVASAVAAGNVDGNVNADDVIKAGTEMVDNTHEKRIYAFYVAFARDMAGRISVDDTKIVKDLQGIMEHYAVKWDGGNPEPLNSQERLAMQTLLKNAKKLSVQQIENYADFGQNFLKKHKK